ncbi:MAG: cellulase [Rhodothermaceae bacterium]|nr:cellulase [Rhodothermaceae bacterium]MBC11611.1 cellulase [Rhodothermaceae bacterium]
MRTLLLVLALSASVAAQTEAIRLNQVGFYPDGPKVAVVVGAGEAAVSIRPEGGGDAVWTGTLGPARTWSASGETVRRVDFSDVTAPGTYVVEVDGVGASYPFEVREAVHEQAARAALKSFYFQRASTDLPEAFAGPWARVGGHPDTQVLVHASAATAERPTGTVLSAPKGWYDAGDYNKYIVNSGISVGTLLSLYEWEPGYVTAFEVGIPESGDAVPDLIDEALWNVRWMLAMQDTDGGVYHKLTTANFEGEVAPDQATATRYVVQKGTAATLDFAATMAQASRIAADFPDALPGLADSLRTAALDAWTWARANPSVRYDQGALNAAFDPNINTGEYGDGSFDDEFDWAAMELYLTTGADSFRTAVGGFPTGGVGLPYWGGVRELGVHSLLAHRADLGPEVNGAALEQSLLAMADRFVGALSSTPYGVPMGIDSWNFGWGSNSVAANQGVALLIAHRLTGDRDYLDAAIASLDYLLGRNATGYSFVTGVGDKTPQNPHHRPSRALTRNPRFYDGPIPGLIAGGPNPGQQDGCAGYPSSLPARSYTDVWCSYASNEVAINWNAPLVHLAVGIEAALSATGGPVDAEPGAEAVDLGLSVSPNPAAGPATVRFRLDEAGDVTVRLVDLLGREVRRAHSGPLAAGPHTVALAAAGLPAGVYVVHLGTPTGAASRALTLVR